MTDDLILVFRSCLRAFVREVSLANTVTNNCNVTEVQCHALLEIENSNELHLNELAIKLGLEKSTVSRTVDNLCKKKLVKRILDKHNRRKVNLSLTKKGKEVTDNINRINNIYFMNVFNNIDEQASLEFVKTLKKITQNMNLLNQQNE